MNFSILLLAFFAVIFNVFAVPLVPDVRHAEDDLPVVRQARQFGSSNAMALANANSMGGGGGYGGYPYGGYGGYPYGGGYGGGSANAMALANANSMG